MSFEWHSRYLPRFHAVQVFLADITRTKPHLDVLNEMLLNHGTDLSPTLAMAMPGWARETATLVGPAPSGDFVALLTGGNQFGIPMLFEDYVDQIVGGQLSHGVQSHRLQWFLIEREFGSEAMELYHNALNDIFEWSEDGGRRSKYLWDLIVDGSSNDEHDFTQPGRLQRYLTGSYRPPNGLRDRLGEELRVERRHFEARKRELNVEKSRQAVDKHAPSPAASIDEAGHRWTGFQRPSASANWTPTIREPNSSLDDQWERFALPLSKPADGLDEQFERSATPLQSARGRRRYRK